MALVVEHTDDFDRSDRDLTDNGWSVGSSGYPCQIISQTLSGLHPNAGRSSMVAAITSLDHWAELTVVTPPPEGDNISVNLRMKDYDSTRYEATAKSTFIAIWKAASGSVYGFLPNTQYDHVVAPGDVIRFEATTGDTNAVLLQVFLNGASIISYIDSGEQYGAAILDGYPGVNMWQPVNAGVAQMGSWRAGTFTVNFSATSVNTNNVIKSAEPITITTNKNSEVTGAYLEEGGDSFPLTLSYDTDSGGLSAAPISVMSTTYSTNTVAVLRVTTASEESTISGVTFELLDSQLQTTLASVSATGLAMNTAAVIDDVSVIDVITGTFIDIDSAGNCTFDPAMPNYTPSVRYLHTARTWDSGDITINQGSAVDLGWKGTPSPPPCTELVPYTFSLSSLITGERPITITSVGEPLPDGLSIVGEDITGTPTVSGTFDGIELQLNN